MQWQIEYSKQASQTLRKLDKTVRKNIEKFIERLPKYNNPREIVKL